jgi:hypothetical protein
MRDHPQEKQRKSCDCGFVGNPALFVQRLREKCPQIFRRPFARWPSQSGGFPVRIKLAQPVHVLLDESFVNACADETV